MGEGRREAIVAELEQAGLRFRTTSAQTEGEYLPLDVEWNTKDLPHLNEVHHGFTDVTVLAKPDMKVAVILQKVLGLTVPLVLVHFDDDDVQRQLHVFTALWWTFVNEIESVPVTTTRTRVTTTYAIGARRPWTLAIPLIAILLRRNNAELMVDDVPMRERRGLLRAWGYTFRGDGERRSILDSIPVHRDNVIAPATAEQPPSGPIALSEITDAAWTFVGRSDHLGLKLRREGRGIVAFPRSCPHEGADLDEVPVEDGCLTCPWHGRRLSPAATLDLDAPTPAATTRWHRLRVADDHLHVTVDGDDVAVTLTPVEGSVDLGR